MINARFMYARPGNLFKEFIIEDNSQQVSSTGRVVNKHSGNGTKTLKGCLANATDKDIENHSIQDHIVTHTIVQSGPPKAKRTDRLILGERSFYICDVDEVGGLGFSTLYYDDTNSSTGSGKRGGKQDRNENQSAGKVKRYEG